MKAVNIITFKQLGYIIFLLLLKSVVHRIEPNDYNIELIIIIDILLQFWHSSAFLKII